jgi:hypothetical protein
MRNKQVETPRSFARLSERPWFGRETRSSHQLIVNQLIWIRSDPQIAPIWAVKGKDHENDQPNEYG